MGNKLFLWWVLGILVIGSASASVLINQVLYNPEATESGGEALELYNSGSDDADISGWAVATEASMHDAVIPENSVLCPGCYYLIADSGWNVSKDNQSWPDAEHEELLNFYNSDSGVALMNGDTTIDAVGWGDKNSIKEGLFEGTPSSGAAEGKSILRINDTGNNADDFAESYPVFSGTSAGNCSAEADIEFEIKEKQDIVAISITPSRIDFGRIITENDYEGEISVENTGNVAVDLGVRCSSFGSISPGTLKYSFNATYAACSSSTRINDVNLVPGANITLKIRLNTPSSSTTGKYAGKLTITASEN